MNKNRTQETYNILLIEDNPGDERLIREMFSEVGGGGYEIFCANTLERGLFQISKNNLHSILLDLSLPDSQGLETFFSVQKHASDLPIIILTGMQDETAALTAVESGAQDYLVKGSIDGNILKRSIQYGIKRKQLEEELSLLATAMQSASNVVFITDTNGFIEWANPAFTRVTGYSLTEVLGEKPSIFKSGLHDNEFYAAMWRTVQSGQVWQSEVTNRRKDGSLFTVEQTVTPFVGKHRDISHFIAIQQDITERKRAAEAEQRRLQELEAVQRIAKVLREAENLEESLPTLMDEVLSALNLTAGQISLFDSKTGMLEMATARGWFNQVADQPLSIHEGIAGKVFSSGETYVTDEFANSEFVYPSARSQIPAKWGGACIPIRSFRSIVGVLFVSCQLPRMISPQEIKLLDSMAEIAGSTIHRLTLLEETRRDAERLAILNKVGKALSESLELDDIYNRLKEAVLGLIPKIATMIISTYDENRELILPAFMFHDGAVQDISGLNPIPLEPPGLGLQSQVIRTRQHLISHDFRKNLKKKVRFVQDVGKEDPGKESLSTQSSLYVPLLAKERVIGVLNLQSYEPDFFTEDHAELLSLIGNTAAVAVENARLFQETQLRHEHLKSLRTIDIAITDGPDLESTLQILLQQVTTQLEVDAANILLLNESINRLEFSAGMGFRSQALRHTNLKIGEGYAGRTVLERKRLEIRNLDTRTTDFLRSPHFSSEGFKVYFGVPLLTKNKVQGVLEVFLRTPFVADEEWLEFLDALAGQAAIAIENTNLFNNLERSNIDLLHAYDATIEGWSKALDLRDKETEGHTQRVTEMTLALARIMNAFTDDELVFIRWGGLLHDIGKMGIPDSILHKPDKLTDDEWAIIQKHPEFAFELISPIKFLNPALDIPYCHHEKWDGSGYPRGLKGEEIPLSARLFAVVDVWDALRSDRPYRPSWTEEKTLAFIREKSGTHFDPQAVQALEALLVEKGGSPENSQPRMPRILIVDDEQYILRSLARSLRDSFIVLPASSAAEALDILKKENVAVVLTDQRMPDVTGLELLKRVIELSPDTKGILLSGYSDSESLAETLILGNVLGFIPKPWNLDDLITQLNKANQAYVNSRRRGKDSGKDSSRAD